MMLQRALERICISSLSRSSSISERRMAVGVGERRARFLCSRRSFSLAAARLNAIG